MSLTASGCVVVHGEREILPSTTRAEAAKALQEFTTAYNDADKAYDGSLDADRTTGALADIDSARLKAGKANNPDGNPNHTPLKLTDAKFTIPKKAGWPRWFLADAAGNKGGSARWLLVFTRSSLDDPFQVAYLTLVAPGKVPQFEKDADGWAESVSVQSGPVPALQPGLCRPGRHHDRGDLRPRAQQHRRLVHDRPRRGARLLPDQRHPRRMPGRLPRPDRPRPAAPQMGLRTLDLRRLPPGQRGRRPRPRPPHPRTPLPLRRPAHRHVLAATN
ncbi:hypothetical protein AB0L17_34730 [Streptomyces cellulosae]